MQFNQFIIFGGCGFIGTHTANLLREKYPDAKVYIADFAILFIVKKNAVRNTPDSTIVYSILFDTQRPVHYLF